MAKQIIVTKDNYGIEIIASLVNQNKESVDVTGQIVEVVIVDDNDTIVDKVEAQHIDSSKGIVSITLQKEHTSTIGLYKTYWSALDENNNVTAQEDIYYYCKDKNGGASNDSYVQEEKFDNESIINKFKETDAEIECIKQDLSNLHKVNVNAEVIDSRGEYNTLGDRLDVVDNDLTGVHLEMESINASLDNMKNEQKEVLVTNFNSWQECVDYCQANKKIMRIPKGEYTINTPINVRGVSVIGDGTNSTIIYLNNTDGFILEEYGSQKQVNIGGFSIIGLDNCFEHCGIIVGGKEIKNHSRGYYLNNIYFENLGCCIETYYCFRLRINNVNGNNVMNFARLNKQTVQCEISSVIINNDLYNATSLRYTGLMKGITIGDSSDTVKPESIRLNNVCLVNFDMALHHANCLYTSIVQCDFDLCRNSAIDIYACDGIFILSDSWINSRNENEEPTILISQSTVEPKKIVVKNCSVSNDNSSINGRYGIKINGSINGVEINGCNVYGGYSHGIACFNNVNPIIVNNISTGIMVGVYSEYHKGGLFANNIVDKTELTSNSTTPYAFYNPFGCDYSLMGSAPVIKDYKV